MERDIRGTALHGQVEAMFRALHQPGTGVISDAAEISTNGTQGVFAGTLVESLNGEAPTRICLTEFSTGDTHVLSFGPNVDRMPKFSADGRQIAFLSDRRGEGNFQLYLLDPVSGAARAAQCVEGWIEYLHWSPNGLRILLGVAGHGADTSCAQGAVTSKAAVDEGAPSWMPTLITGKEGYRWRRAWVYDLVNDRVRQVSRDGINIWEAAWCGNESLVAIVSPGPEEGLWYSAALSLIEIESGDSRELYAPQNDQQLGWPSASPSGKQVAVVEAICSDRWFVAGDLRLIDSASGEIRTIDTREVDITHTEWRSDHRLLLAGHRGFETVVGIYDTRTALFAEVWSSRERTTPGIYASVSGFDDAGDCVILGENFLRGPEIAVIRRGDYQPVRSFDVGYAEQAEAMATVERVNWQAPDGLDLQGWLLRPDGTGPHPLIMKIHGGPVWHWRPTWLGRGGASIFMLVRRGYAVFFPNPRGSTGRGQAFARRVLGDMGGADTYDCLAGIDHLVEQGVADPERLGVTGLSYGGFMTSWLITQDSRFAAAVAVAPITNYVSEHMVSNIPQFVTLFLADRYDNPGGEYFRRSPIMFAHKAKTPTLNICGALDRCTPPEEAMQFHHALLENGVESALITYPEEGHGIHKLPAAMDYCTRIVSWFETHMPVARDT